MSHCQKLAADTNRVIAAATGLSGDAGRAAQWFRTHALDVFRGKTAEQLVLEGRTDDVIKYIESIEAGAAG